MSTITHPLAGRVWEKAESVSLAGSPTTPRHQGIVVATLRRPLWSIKGEIPALPEVLHPDRVYGETDRRVYVPEQKTSGRAIPAYWRRYSPSAWAVREALAPYRDQVDPALFREEQIWLSITHNDRVNMGGALSVSAIFGTVGTAPNGVVAITAIATTGFTSKTATDLSIGSGSANATTNEFTTIGLARVASTVQNYVAETALNGVYSVDVFKSFSLSGGGTAHGAALFDSATVSGSHLYCEDTYDSDAVCISGDTLQNTWTVSN